MNGLDEDVKKKLLEELLIEAEKRYNYDRSTKIHPKFDVLSKQEFRQQQFSDPAVQPSESFARAKELLKKIVAEKKKLTQSNEKLKSLKTKISTKHSGDKVWDNRKDDVEYMGKRGYWTKEQNKS